MAELRTSDAHWEPIADGVSVRRHRELDLSTGLVVGDRSCLVIDTCGDRRQGAELAAAVREVTPLPWIVVYTHGHFDHCFGTEAFLPCPIWGHEALPGFLAESAVEQRALWAARYRAQGAPRRAADLEGSQALAPDHTVTDRVEIDLGGRTVVLEHLGPAHTDHDLIVTVPDVDVVFTGDLVEQGAVPAFEGSSPRDWADVLLRLADRGTAATRFIPGHGHPVDTTFVRTQAIEVRELVELASAISRGEAAVDSAGTHPYGAATVEEVRKLLA
ncbi:MBL fold metallo-hydrolase [Actinoalloteichus hymeniacidonis]|uniref:Zn-dependent hydrolase, glyoxylase n=1 Tax=Actinoalloteichus hymeniacidonis TaxID=340345 RepID=A0AAC9HPX3_9PSEU|nr:MBL fold metallo-hydrolase [Actinoalloteichus hymeniacidonis]AOS62405.1 Zn-dependent hydrolase, glyoxylase [Actinoalloteichus hymeniacidonis]MBB5909564.1 glyoxylase-like metal-dependent hydrolase (beta-lactamase superfamily II) [Actinoalloteichus hymeniacidonis]